MVVSLGFAVSGCARIGQAHKQTFTTMPVLSSTEDRQVCAHESLNTKVLAQGVQAVEFHFTHPRVTLFVARFESNGRGSLASALLRSRQYVPRISAILLEDGLPPELAYLPLIESGFQPQAISRAGAVGLWQLLASTGRHYGLRIDRHIDERRDPIKSTRAAARYLKDLHEAFGDWHLALAAYNSGEHALSRLLARSPSVSFWELRMSGHLHAETADFVPKFLAAVQIAESPEAHGFNTVARQ